MRIPGRCNDPAVRDDCLTAPVNGSIAVPCRGGNDPGAFVRAIVTGEKNNSYHHKKIFDFHDKILVGLNPGR